MMTRNAVTPLRDFMSLRDAMDRLVEESFLGPGAMLSRTTNGTRPLPLDIYETPDDIVVRAFVPGVDPEGIDIQYQRGLLTLRAKTTAPALDDDWTWHVREIASGEAVRQITLPREVDVEQAKTTYEDGVLNLTLPKSPDAKPKQIRVSTAEQPTPASRAS